MPLMSDNLRSAASALLVIALVIAGLVLGKDILLPLAMAAILGFVLFPVVRRLSRAIPHGAAVTLALLLCVGVLGSTSALVSSQVLSLAASLDTYRSNIVEKVRLLRGAGEGGGVLSRAATTVDSIGDAIEQELADKPAAPPTAPAMATAEARPARVVIAEPPANAWESVGQAVESAIAPVAKLGLTILFAMFLLLQHADLRDRVVRVAGTNNITGTTAAMSEAGSRLSTLFLTQSALNAGFGFVVGVALLAIGVPNAPLWGILAAIMRFVPFIGSVLAAVPPILLAAAVDPGWTMVIATAALFVIGEPLMGHIVEPLVLGKRAGLSPLAMVIAASFWTLVWGPIGLILAAPLTLILVVLGRYVKGLEVFTVLLGDEPALKPHEAFYHRLLSRDAVGAADAAETRLDKASPAEVADEIIVPALALAASDLRWGNLDRDGARQFQDTFASFLDLSEGLLEPAVAKAVSGEGRRILVVAARGEADAAAALLLGRLIGAKAGPAAVGVAPSAGLTAIAEAVTGARPIGTLVIVTVGGIEQAHLKFILRRARRDCPVAEIFVFDAAPGADPDSELGDSGATRMTSARSLVERLSYTGKSGSSRGEPLDIAV